jgi:hypothetical protein
MVSDSGDEETGSTPLEARFRSIIIRMLLLGIEPCGIDEPDLNAMNEFELINCALQCCTPASEQVPEVPAPVAPQPIQEDPVPIIDTDALDRKRAMALRKKLPAVVRLDLFNRFKLEGRPFETLPIEEVRAYYQAAEKLLRKGK